jgi:hypothetical protein
MRMHTIFQFKQTQREERDHLGDLGIDEIITQVTLVIRVLAFRVMAYPRFYFNIMRNINILSAATVEAAAQAH